MTATITNKALELLKEIQALNNYIRQYHIMVLSGLVDNTSESPKRKIYQLILSKIVIKDNKENRNRDFDNNQIQVMMPGVMGIPIPKPKYDYDKMSDRDIAKLFQNIRTDYCSLDSLNSNKESHIDFDLSQNVMNRVGIMTSKLENGYSYGQVYGLFVHENELAELASFMIKIINNRKQVLINLLKEEGVDYGE